MSFKGTFFPQDFSEGDKVRYEARWYECVKSGGLLKADHTTEVDEASATDLDSSWTDEAKINSGTGYATHSVDYQNYSGALEMETLDMDLFNVTIVTENDCSGFEVKIYSDTNLLYTGEMTSDLTNSFDLPYVYSVDSGDLKIVFYNSTVGTKTIHLEYIKFSYCCVPHYAVAMGTGVHCPDGTNWEVINPWDFEYIVDEDYVFGDVVRYENKLYKCLSNAYVLASTPTSHSDPDSHWVNEANAYDGDTSGVYADVPSGTLKDYYEGYLVLTLSQFRYLTSILFYITTT